MRRLAALRWTFRDARRSFRVRLADDEAGVDARAAGGSNGVLITCVVDEMACSDRRLNAKVRSEACTAAVIRDDEDAAKFRDELEPVLARATACSEKRPSAEATIMPLDPCSYRGSRLQRRREKMLVEATCWKWSSQRCRATSRSSFGSCASENAADWLGFSLPCFPPYEKIRFFACSGRVTCAHSPPNSLHLRRLE